MEEDLVARLLANAGLSALVGVQINWLDRPQAGALPAVTLQMISPGRDYTYAGALNTAATRVQGDSWGRSYLEAKQVSRALVAAIEPAGLQGGTRFGASFVDSGSDFPPEDMPGGTKVYRVTTDFIIWNSPA
jgi:hypothetical protein